jgi:hypothetical protein
MAEFNKPDVKGPRFRKKVKYLLNDDAHKAFIKKNPKYKDLSNKEFSNIVKKFSTYMWEQVIENRDGIELPEGLGYIFIGRHKISRDIVDVTKSIKYGKRILAKNWETDGNISKIIYTNYSPKYKLENREIWGFKGTREFKRSVSRAFKENWEKYVVVDNYRTISNLYTKSILKERRENQSLEDYNEFEI